jgi:hypothetical protein
MTDDYCSVLEERIRGIESVPVAVGSKIVHATDEFALSRVATDSRAAKFLPVKILGATARR